MQGRAAATARTPARQAPDRARPQVALRCGSLEPPEHRGQTFDLDDEVTLGRSPACVVVPRGRHLRLVGPRPGVPPRRRGVARGPRLDQRHLPQRRAPRRRRPAPARRPGEGRATPCSRCAGEPTVRRAGCRRDALPLRRRAPTPGASARSNQDLALVDREPRRRRRRHGRPRRWRGGRPDRGRTCSTRPSTATTAPTALTGRLPTGRTETIFERSERRPRAPRHGHDAHRGGDRLGGATASSSRVVNVGDSRAYLLNGGRALQPHRGPQPRRGDGPPRRAHRRRGRGPSRTGTSSPGRSASTRGWRSTPGCSSLRPGTRLLLCSDGLTNECGDDEIALVLTEYEDPTEAAQALVRRRSTTAATTTSPSSSPTSSKHRRSAAATRPPADEEAEVERRPTDDSRAGAPADWRREGGAVAPATDGRRRRRPAVLVPGAAGGGQRPATADQAGRGCRWHRVAIVPRPSGRPASVPRSSRPQSLLVLDPGGRQQRAGRSRGRPHRHTVVGAVRAGLRGRPRGYRAASWAGTCARPTSSASAATRS